MHRAQRTSSLSSGNDRPVRDEAERTQRSTLSVGDTNALLSRRLILTRSIHQVTWSTLRRRNDLRSPEEARLTRPWWEGSWKHILVMVSPATKVAGVGALDVLSVGVGTVCVPFVRSFVVEDAGICKVVVDHWVDPAQVRMRCHGRERRAG